MYKRILLSDDLIQDFHAKGFVALELVSIFSLSTSNLPYAFVQEFCRPLYESKDSRAYEMYIGRSSCLLDSRKKGAH